MTSTLISFLGRVPKEESGYRTTRYSFDGKKDEETAFIGWSLHRRLRPSRMVILGTAGSMWDHLFEKDFNLGDEAEDERLILQEATENKTVTPDLLEPLIPLLEKNLGCEIQLRIIPYCRTESEQLELLRIMAEEVNENEKVHLDVTHGFRHLPMLALLSALHLREVKKAEIAGIWYGAFDPDTEEAPVYNLAGLLRLADWIGALKTFDKDGDYGVFTELMRADGLSDENLNHLQRAAFRERTSNAWEAKKYLGNFDAVLKSGLPGISALFAEPLQNRIDWHKGQDLLALQRKLAEEYLQRGDYIRAVIYAFEGFKTRLIDPSKGERFWDHGDRDKAQEEYYEKKRQPQSLYGDYHLLRKLRNTLAHGERPKPKKDGQPDKEIERIVNDPELLQQELQRLIKSLLTIRD